MTEMLRKLSLKSVKQMSGSHKYPAIHKSLLRVGTNQIDTKQTNSRLCPINRAPKGQPLYDTIAFFIFCPKHRKIAVCNTYHLNHEIAVWLPFIYLSNEINATAGMVDGLCLILSDYETNLLHKYKEEIPFGTKITKSIEIYLPNTNKSVTRINCLAILHTDTPGFQCCQKTSLIRWLSVEDVCTSSAYQFWGPQVRDMCLRLENNYIPIKRIQHLLVGPELDLGRNYYENNTIDTEEDYILYSLGITRKQIDLFFNDYFKHCFPSVSMCFESFADYLTKYGFRETDTKMRRLFNSFIIFERASYKTTPCLIFDDLLFGLAYIDKDSPHNTCRLEFVFNCYDLNRDGFLSEVEFREMVTDIHKNEGQEEIDRIVADGMNGTKSLNVMNYNEFYNRAESHEFGDATLLGKSYVSLIRNICEDIKAKNTRPMDTLIKLFIKYKEMSQ